MYLLEKCGDTSLHLLYLTQYSTLLKIAIRAGADPGIEVRGCNIIYSMESGAASGPPVCPGLALDAPTAPRRYWILEIL
jgi:hypothetical protein